MRLVEVLRVRTIKAILLLSQLRPLKVLMACILLLCANPEVSVFGEVGKEIHIIFFQGLVFQGWEASCLVFSRMHISESSPVLF